jgi:regulator of sigma E protease
MSGIWVQVLQFILALSLLIVLHEGGHFFFARLFKTRVEKFYLFFDFLFPFSNILPFSIFKKKKGDTTYGIGWFPLGGYVKIAGMVDESMDKEQLAKPPQPWEFRSKKAWQRLLIMLGGIIVNVLLAFVIYSMVLFVWGEKKLPLSELKNGILVADSMAYDLGFRNGDKIVAVNGKSLHYYNELMPELLYAKTVEVVRSGADTTLVMPVNFVEKLIDNKSKSLFAIPFPAIVGEVTPQSHAEQAGLKKADKIISINGQRASDFMEVKKAVEAQKGKQIQLEVLRNEQPLALTAQVSDSGTLGFAFALPDKISDYEKSGLYHFETKRYNILESVPAGVAMATDKLNFYVQQFKLILNPATGAYKGLGGFISIGKIYPPEWNWQHFWEVTAFLSIILAFMNLLPIPGLDGGYVLFTLIEMATGRKVNEKILEVATTIGLVLLLALMLYANGMDIFRLFKK